MLPVCISKSYRQKSVQPTLITIQEPSILEKAVSSMEYSCSVMVSSPTFSYNWCIIDKNTKEWNSCPFVKIPAGWGQSGSKSLLESLFGFCQTPLEQYLLLWFSRDPIGPRYMMVLHWEHVAGFLCDYFMLGVYKFENSQVCIAHSIWTRLRCWAICSQL